MACERDDSIRLFFPRSGIELAPSETDMRDQRRKFAVGEFRLPLPAGELVSERVHDEVPVEVHIGETLSRRLMYDEGSLEFNRKTDETDVADLQLYDPSRILNNGSITKNFNNTSLRNIIDYIMAQVDDDQNVIESHSYVMGSEPDATRRPRGEFMDRTTWLFRRSPIPYSETVGNWIDDANAALADKVLDDVYNGFDFVNASPLEALEEVTNEFKLNWWVDRTGILRIGLDRTTGQIVGVIGGSDDIKLKRYAITSDPDKVSSVFLKSPYVTLTQRRDKGPFHEPGFGGSSGPVGLVRMAEAKDPTSDGSQIVGTAETGIEDLEDLEQAAERELIRQMMDRENGSLEINALASEDKPAIARMNVGDIITIGDGVSVRCSKDLVTGAFLITGIDHKSNARQGWSVSLDVARVPRLGEVETRSVVYDPQTDKRYEDFDEFDEDFTLFPEFGGLGVPGVDIDDAI